MSASHQQYSNLDEKILTVSKKLLKGVCIMPLLGYRYKAMASTELERDLQRIEEKDKKAQTKQEFDLSCQNFNSNLNFAERINLISVQQADVMRERVRAAILKFEHMQRVEYNDIVDDFENPRERTQRYMNMEEVQAEITREKAEKNTNTYSTPQKTEELER